MYEDVIVPDVLLVNPCKECKYDSECPGGYHCVVSTYLGLTIINGYEEECIVKQEMDISPFDALKTCVPTNAPIHDLYCDSRYDVIGILKNMYSAGWSHLIHQYLFMSPSNGFRFFDNGGDSKFYNINVDYPFVEKRNWEFDEMLSQFEEEMVELLFDSIDKDARKPIANGMFFASKPRANLFNTQRRRITASSVRSAWRHNISYGQNTLRRDLSIAINFPASNFVESCMRTTTQDPADSGDVLGARTSWFVPVDKTIYKTVTRDGTFYDCSPVCLMEFSRNSDCLATYSTGFQNTL